MLAGLSLLACVASAALLARSYFAADNLSVCKEDGYRRMFQIYAASNSSWVFVGFDRINRLKSDAMGLHWSSSPAEDGDIRQIDSSMGSLPAQIRLPGIRVRWTARKVAQNDTIRTFVLIIRIWIPLLLCTILPTIWLWRRHETSPRQLEACKSLDH